MTLEKFNEYIKTELDNEFDEILLEQFWQVNYSRLRTRIENKKYDCEYLWEKTQNIISLACFLISSNSDNEFSIKRIEICARLLENLANVDDCTLDIPFIKLISAFCYDISGYQANTYCISKEIKKYEFNSNEEFSVKEDNKIIKILILILQKKIPYARYLLINDSDNCSPCYLSLKNALLAWFSFILDLKDTDYISDFHQAFLKYLNTNNLYISTLLQLLEAKIKISDGRSVKNILENSGIQINDVWNKYLKIKTNDLYASNQFKKLENRHSIYEFWVSQICAIKNGLLDSNESFVIKMPTSAGKTFVAELFLLNHLLKGVNNRVLYISPFNALSNEKEIDFANIFEKLGFSVSTFPESYEIDLFQELGMIETDLLISTPEKIDVILRENKEYFNNITAIVIDEGHIVGDKGNRGQLVEFLIIRLKYYYPNIKYLYISAVIPEINAKDFSIWLSDDEKHILRSKQFKNDKKDWMPTRKLICQYKWNTTGGSIIFHNQGTIDDEENLPSILDYFPENIRAFLGSTKPKKTTISASLAYDFLSNGQVLVFSGYPKRIILVAKELLKIIKYMETLYGKATLIPNKNTESYYYSSKYYNSDDIIPTAISYGIGIHYGDLPEQIRKSVENDYNRGLLKILICTNTVGQGINFPIKNLIFDNVYYAPGDKNSKLSINDYSNLIGRAGRAEKETEGIIIFVNNSWTDNNDLYFYLQNENKEINSCLYSYIKELIDQRITLDSFYEDISRLIDTYLIDLLVEEGISTDEEIEKLMDKIIDLSLFSVQCRRNELNLTSTKHILSKICKTFLEQIPQEDYKLFKDTGLFLSTTKSMMEYLKKYIDENREFELTKENIIHYFLEYLSKYEVQEIKEDWKLGKLDLDFLMVEDIILNWINGEDYKTLISSWNSLGLETNKFYVFEARGLNYLFPWLLTGFLKVYATLKRIDSSTLLELNYFPIYLKNGLSTNVACLCKSLGILSRDTCKFLDYQFSQVPYSNFILWFSNLSITEINLFDIPKWEKNNIIKISQKITPCSSRSQPSYFTFIVKGTYFNEEYKINSTAVNKTSILTLKRDFENEYDPYAIFVMHNNIPIGFIPKEYSKFISTEMDINNSEYEVKILNIYPKTAYNEIYIKISKQEEY